MDPDGIIGGAIASALRDLQRREAQHLVDLLGAPIFARLMLEHQMNPLGIERWEDRALQAGPGEWLDEADSTRLRVGSRVLFVQTRPHPKELV